VERVGMSGHFFVPEIVAGGFGKRIFVFGLIHLLIVDQSLGIPVLTLPSPEYGKYFEYAKYGSVYWYLFYRNEHSKNRYPVFVKTISCLTNRNMTETNKKKIFTV
jgi:hypothetical protein